MVFRECRWRSGSLSEADERRTSGGRRADGIRRIDGGSIDEFVRRADLYSTYVGSMMYEGAHGRPVAMTRKILADAMGDNVAVARPGVELIDPGTFDRQIQSARVNR